MAVFLAVHGFLADEAGDPFLEVRVCDPVGEPTHRPDEPLFTRRESCRQARNEVAVDHIAVDEVLLLGFLVEPEANPPGLRVRRRRATSICDCRGRLLSVAHATRPFPEQSVTSTVSIR
jgi:hypothetical protein